MEGKCASDPKGPQAVDCGRDKVGEVKTGTVGDRVQVAGTTASGKRE